MNLENIVISNFKGIVFNSFEFQKNTIISGPNESGKTTVMNAWLWLTTGTPMQIKPVDDPDAITTVTATIDGIIYSRTNSEDGDKYTIDFEATTATKFRAKFRQLREYSLPKYILNQSTDKKRKLLFGKGADKLNKASEAMKKAKKKLKEYSGASEWFKAQKSVIRDIVEMRPDEYGEQEYYEASELNTVVGLYRMGRRRKLAEEMELAKEVAECKRVLDTEKVKSKLPYDVILTEEQKNGGIKNVCELVDEHGVPWSQVNHAKQVQMGVDVIRHLSKKNYPIWIDDAEGIQDIPEYDGQIILLQADNGDRSNFKEERV